MLFRSTIPWKDAVVSVAHSLFSWVGFACSAVALAYGIVAWAAAGMRPPGRAPLQLAVLPLRDILSVGPWTWSFVARGVHRREDRYHVTRDGSALPIPRCKSF